MRVFCRGAGVAWPGYTPGAGGVCINYRTIDSLVSIQRRYRSNRTTEDSPFGKGWSFNHHSRILIGRTPLLKERATLLADLSADSEAGDLAAKATNELNKALNTLEAAELGAEEELFPDNPFPADASLYFGKGFVKLVDGDGSPILFAIQADTSYKPVIDKGSYTDRIVAIEGGFQVIGKNGEIKEYSDTGKGYALLSKDIDTNGNQTTFSRTDEHLTAIIDAVGRRTEISYDADGHITGIVDPLGNTYTYVYENGSLGTYTDPMQYAWGY